MLSSYNVSIRDGIVLRQAEIYPDETTVLTPAYTTLLLNRSTIARTTPPSLYRSVQHLYDLMIDHDGRIHHHLGNQGLKAPEAWIQGYTHFHVSGAPNDCACLAYKNAERSNYLLVARIVDAGRHIFAPCPFIIRHPPKGTNFVSDGAVVRAGCDRFFPSDFVKGDASVQNLTPSEIRQLNKAGVATMVKTGNRRMVDSFGINWLADSRKERGLPYYRRGI